MTKRRMFDIGFPDDDLEAVPAGTEAAPRRGPMAAAITENAEALRERAGPALVAERHRPARRLGGFVGVCIGR